MEKSTVTVIADEEQPQSWAHGEDISSKLPWYRSIPWTGLIGLVGALTTAFLSFAVLKSIDGAQSWTGSSGLKPASFISVILSANSILLHIALSEGVNVAWWYKANQKHTTAGELHEYYAYGNSLFAALKAGRRFNYVSLATIFIATIPINGLILQGAISTYPDTWVIPGWEITTPQQRQLPLGFSATVNPQDGSLGMLSPNMAGTQSTFVNLAGNQFPQAIALMGVDTGCQSTCHMRVQAAGFKHTCSAADIQNKIHNDTHTINK